MRQPAMLEDELFQAMPDKLPGQAPALLRQLLAAADVQERRRCLLAAFNEAGIDWLAYGRARLDEGRPRSTHVLQSHAHRSWLERYFSNGWEDIDPRSARRPMTGAPSMWTTDALCAALPTRSSATQTHFELVRHLRDCGIGGGTLFRFSNPYCRDEWVWLCLSSERAESTDEQDRRLPERLLLSACVHAFYARHACVRTSTGDAGNVSRLRVLRALAQGLSNKQIAHRLDLSVNSVEHHVRQLRRRFAAVNRVALAREAASRCGPLAID